jgi:hypothetical protein
MGWQQKLAVYLLREKKICPSLGYCKSIIFILAETHFGEFKFELFVLSLILFGPKAYANIRDQICARFVRQKREENDIFN